MGALRVSFTPLMAGFRLFDLNPEQQKAVLSIEGPLLILAGAGTGKTRVITARTAYLIDEKVPPSSILAVTFTNKAADEMRERLRSMTDPMDAKQVTMCTFHALCVRLLRSDIDACPGNLSHLLPRGFVLEDHQITLYGKCPACR